MSQGREVGRQGGDTGLSDETSSGQVEPLHKAEMVLDTGGAGQGEAQTLLTTKICLDTGGWNRDDGTQLRGKGLADGYGGWVGGTQQLVSHSPP